MNAIDRSDSTRKPGAWRWGIGLLVSLACIYLALREVNWSEVDMRLREADLWLLTLGVGSVLATFLAKARRWTRIFPREQRPRLATAFRIQSIGMLLNTFLPARLGDLGRAYWMGEAQSLRKAFALGTLVVEKLMDLILVVLTLGVVMLQMSLPDWILIPWQRLSIAVGLAVLVVGGVIWQRMALLRLIQRVSGRAQQPWLAWLSEQAAAGVESFSMLGQAGQLSVVVVWSLIAWGLSASTNAILFLALGVKVPPGAAWLLLVVLQLGVAVPSSPGRIGVFHYLTLLVLQLYGVAHGVALSVGILLHLVVVGSITAVGLICLWRQKITWADLRQHFARFNPREGN